MPTTSFTTRIDAALKAELEQIARYEDRSASYMANLAIRSLVEEHKATRELVETGLELIGQDTPSIAPRDVHDWFMTEDDAPLPSKVTTT